MTGVEITGAGIYMILDRSQKAIKRWMLSWPDWALTMIFVGTLVIEIVLPILHIPLTPISAGLGIDVLLFWLVTQPAHDAMKARGGLKPIFSKTRERYLAWLNTLHFLALAGLLVLLVGVEVGLAWTKLEFIPVVDTWLTVMFGVPLMDGLIGRALRALGVAPEPKLLELQD